MSRKVVAYNHLPTRCPLFTGIILWLLFDRLHAPGWAYGVAGTLLVVLFISWIASIWLEDRRDPFKLEEELEKKSKAQRDALSAYLNQR